MRLFLNIAAVVWGAAGLSANPAAPAAQAQAVAGGDTLVFEEVGDRAIDAYDLAFDAEGALWASAADLLRLPSGWSAWEEVSDLPYRYVLPLAPPDTLLLGGNTIRRSVNGGHTFVEVSEDGEQLFEASAGALLAGARVGTGALYSEDRGATWLPGLINAGTWVPWAEAFAELPPGHPYAGRLVAACWAGMSYSDDRGHTWAKSSLWQDGGRYHAYSVAVGADGRVYAAFYESGVSGLQIGASSDGGATYAVAYQSGIYRGTGVRIVALPGGADPEVGVIVVVEFDGSVWRSDDGAQSFRLVGEVPFVYPLSGMRDALIGPDGRLYVSGTAPGTEEEWVWRTVGPVVLAAVTVQAEPLNPPVVIGPSGGSFQFTVTLTNTTGQAQSFEAWTAAAGPYTVSPVLGPLAVTLPSGGTLTRTLTQRVPGSAPPGTYTYSVAVGDFPGAVLSSDGFPVEKQSSSGISIGASPQAGSLTSGVGIEEWSVSGWEASATGAEAVQLSVSPNPARGRAVIAFSLPVPSAVRLAVYDLLGREVALLVDEAHDAGRYEAVFDGSRLPAGTYLVKLAAGGEMHTRTLTLVR
jgi:hypothetical protein